MELAAKQFFMPSAGFIRAAAIGLMLAPPPLPYAIALHAQASGAAGPTARLVVPESAMAGHCTTMVSPNYPQGSGSGQQAASVTLRVVISSTGAVAPLYMVSGLPALEAEAENAARQWKYHPYLRDNQPVDVMTEIKINFYPGRPGNIITHPSR